jgi:hypothetical protein
MPSLAWMPQTPWPHCKTRSSAEATYSQESLKFAQAFERKGGKFRENYVARPWDKKYAALGNKMEPQSIWIGKVDCTFIGPGLKVGFGAAWKTE